TALFILCYPIKGLFFLTSDDPLFALGRYPSMAELPRYVMTALLISAFFWVVISKTYQSVLPRFMQRVARQPAPDLVRNTKGEIILAVLGTAAALFWLQREGLTALGWIANGTALLRKNVPEPDAYMSGALGIVALQRAVSNGIIVATAVLGVLR